MGVGKSPGKAAGKSVDHWGQRWLLRCMGLGGLPTSSIIMGRMTTTNGWGGMGNVTLMLEEGGDDRINKEFNVQMNATKHDDKQTRITMTVPGGRDPLRNATRRKPA